MIHFLLTPVMKSCLIKESYILPDDLFYQPISYVTVSLTLFLFFSLSDRAHQPKYELLLCSSVSFYIRPKSIIYFQTSHQPFYHSCICLDFFHIFFNPCQGRFIIPKAFLILSPPPPMRCIPNTHWNLIL